MSWCCLVTGHDTDVLRATKRMQPVSGMHALTVEYLPVCQSWDLFYVVAAFPARPDPGMGPAL